MQILSLGCADPTHRSLLLQVWTAAMDGRIYTYSDNGAGSLTDMKTLSHESMRSGVRSLAHVDGCVYSGAEDGHVACWAVESETFRSSEAVHGNIVSTLCSVGDLVCRTGCCQCSFLATGVGMSWLCCYRMLTGAQGGCRCTALFWCIVMVHCLMLCIVAVRKTFAAHFMPERRYGVVGTIQKCVPLTHSARRCIMSAL